MEEDKSLSDGEDKGSSELKSPNMGSKKLKLNDGSSQESLQETVASTSKEENVDSGVSVDKSDSTSSVAACSSAGPSNEVVQVSASGSNVKTILLNIRQPIRQRNYRKRKTPEQDTDSNASFDSDDLSAADSVPVTSNNASESDALYENADLQRLMDLCNDTDNSNDSNTRSSPSSSSSSTSINNDDGQNGYESDGPIPMISGDTDTDSEPSGWTTRRAAATAAAPDESPSTMPEVLLKERPKHNFLILKEIINREMGLSFPYGKTSKEDVMFTQRFYGSLHSVYRLKKLHQLHRHRGCVNSINFHPEGKLLVSGSDDMNIVVWNWARNIAYQTIKTGHKSNVFQSKFLYLNAQSQLNIVTCARDGQVRLIQCPPSGGSGTRRRLASHTRAAHKLHVTPHEPHSVLSAGEDGYVLHVDVRQDHPNRLLQVKENDLAIALYSVHGHPLDPREMILAGRDQFIRMYDRRKCDTPVAIYSPSCLDKKPTTTPKRRLPLTHLTCAIYNHNGREILGSYNDNDIYLFDVQNDVYKKENKAASICGYSKLYSGHRNSATYKGVSFFGPHSEYVVSGSDCGNIYVWSRSHESIVQWMKGDASGVVNCIETHPSSPVLATCGLDRDVKVWVPCAAEDPTFANMERVVRENVVAETRSPLFNDFLPTLYNAWRHENRLDSGEEHPPPPFNSNIDFDGNVCTIF